MAVMEIPRKSKYKHTTKILFLFFPHKYLLTLFWSEQNRTIPENGTKNEFEWYRISYTKPVVVFMILSHSRGSNKTEQLQKIVKQNICAFLNTAGRVEAGCSLWNNFI